jgi:hypothetical protein
MKNIILLIAVFCTYSLLAQTDLPTGKIEVVKDFEVRLTETKKIRIVPQPVPLDSAVRQYEYRLLAPSPSIEYLVPELKPLAINAEKKPQYYPLYVKAGYGSPNSFLGMASYDHIQSDKFQWGVDYRQLTANNKKIPLQKFSDIQGRVNATYWLKEHVHIDGYIDGHIEKVYFYGAEDIPSNPESLKRRFNRYDAYVQLAKVYSPESSLSYKAFLQYMGDRDDLGSKESALRIGGEVGSAFGSSDFPVGMRVMADVSKLVHIGKYAVNNLLVEPFFAYGFGHLGIHLGGKILLSNQENEILPDISFSLPLFNARMTLVAGWVGEVSKNNFHFLSSYNPYISTRLDSLNNMISRQIYAGVKGGSGKLVYELKGNYTSFERMAFFLQDEFEEEEFVPVYDDGTYIGLEGSVRYEILKHVFLRAQVSQRFYSLDHEAKPWHRPSLGLNGQLTYAGGEDQFHVSFIFNGENGLPYRTPGGTEDVLDPLIDLNLHGDYYFSKSFGAFMEVNNLLGNNRERWATYPSYGFNAKAGILFRLP